MPDRDMALQELQRIPGVGPSLADDLYRLGFRHVEDLRDKDPEAIYRSLMALEGTHVDRCVLYVFRCAVYFASNSLHDEELLKWWNWKDRENLQ
ncbi:helix-hairpin-helix domain-containing protein [Salidesulfovibrio onnuriiensis]|uniref:helix-hairpin-helix domain-containing protein n=1 Tax=Salidesulfovibrio onnuriiensis TaxID=2583823 RepID=UPI0011C8D0D6|nr:helix-hairpin-helix domain-containing protein [Salidesulfovibrio onnuriiensis]